MDIEIIKNYDRNSVLYSHKNDRKRGLHVTGIISWHVLQTHREVLGRRSNEEQAGHLPPPGPWSLDMFTEEGECSVDSQVSVRARGHLMERNIMSFRREREREIFPWAEILRRVSYGCPMKGW